MIRSKHPLALGATLIILASPAVAAPQDRGERARNPLHSQLKEVESYVSQLQAELDALKARGEHAKADVTAAELQALEQQYANLTDLLHRDAQRTTDGQDAKAKRHNLQQFRQHLLQNYERERADLLESAKRDLAVAEKRLEDEVHDLQVARDHAQMDYQRALDRMNSTLASENAEVTDLTAQLHVELEAKLDDLKKAAAGEEAMQSVITQHERQLAALQDQRVRAERDATVAREDLEQQLHHQLQRHEVQLDRLRQRVATERADTEAKSQHQLERLEVRLQQQLADLDQHRQRLEQDLRTRHENLDRERAAARADRRPRAANPETTEGSAPVVLQMQQSVNELREEVRELRGLVRQLERLLRHKQPH